MEYFKIGTTKTWIGELSLPENTYTPESLQGEITAYVEESRHTVTGAYLAHSAKLLLLHWPETRKGYIEQSLEECEIMQHELAEKLQAKAGDFELEPNELLCMMGRRVGGYTDGRIADMDELSAYETLVTMQPAHMVSARARNNGETESYGEPTALLRGPLSGEQAIHKIGDQLEQHHYGIQRGTGVTDFYETKWAQ